tara:strand:+ start:510 stop:1172 length:663 start_codon:yes stop_codon:yes gene_type:complete
MINNNLHKLLDKKFIGDSNLIIRVEKNDKIFNAGQFYSVGIPDLPINREYSVCNSANDDYIEFLIRYVDGGTLTPKLFNTNIGENIKVLGPYGEFYLKDFDINKKYLFIGTGTGIAPFLSIIKTHNIINYKIMHGIRELKDKIDGLDSEKYEIYLSREKCSNQNNVFEGRVTNFIKEKLDNIDKKNLFFLCGNSLMVSEVHEMLILNNINNNQIFSEIFF